MCGHHSARAQRPGAGWSSASSPGRRPWGDIVDQLIARVAENRPARRNSEAGVGSSGKLAGSKRAEIWRILFGQRDRQLVKPGIVTDQQYVDIRLVNPAQAIHQSLSTGEVELVLDDDARSRGKL